MIWNKKRIKDMQVYKEKKDSFMIVFFENRHPFTHTAFCGVWENANPNNNSFCHSNCSDAFLSERCYPVSQRQLRKHPEWYEFFSNYIKDLGND